MNLLYVMTIDQSHYPNHHNGGLIIGSEFLRIYRKGCVRSERYQPESTSIVSYTTHRRPSRQVLR